MGACSHICERRCEAVDAVDYPSLSAIYTKLIPIKPASTTELELFRNWCHAGRVEEMTCRPIINGKKAPNNNEKNFLAYTLEEFDEPVGRFMYFDYNSGNRSCEFGYLINPKYRGQGLSSKMVKDCIDYLFRDESLNLNKLYCQTAEFNIPSVKMLESVGLKKDAILREHHELDGELHNDLIYSILRSEWKNKDNFH